MVSCKACGRGRSKSSTKKNITFHRFPKDAVIYREWMNFVNKHNPFVTIQAQMFLCSQHFNKEDFDTSSPWRKVLKENIIPTIEVKRIKYAKTKYDEEELQVSLVNSDSEEVTPSDFLETEINESPIEQDQPMAPVCELRLDLGSIPIDTSPLTESDMVFTTDDTPYTMRLKRLLKYYVGNDKLKSKKLKDLQTEISHQRTKIKTLVNKISELQKKS